MQRLFAAAIALALALGCQRPTPLPATTAAPSAPPNTYSPSPAPSVVGIRSDPVATVFDSPFARGSLLFAIFPRSPGTRPCSIPVGGPPRASAYLPGTCRTAVAPRGSGYLVTLTESWGASGSASQGSGGFHTTWPFSVSWNGKVVPLPITGDVPPQLMR